MSNNSVRAVPLDNSPPTFTETTPTRTIAENAQANAPVGGRVTATDPDSDDTVRYEFEPRWSDLFTIDGNSGQIRVKAQGALDYEDPANRSHTVTVKASDSSNAFDTVQVTIEVTDVNEPPNAAPDTPDTPDTPDSFDEDTAITIDVLDNDSDPGDDRSALPLTVVTSPGNGRATVNEPANVGQNRTITYEPNANYTGTDTFTYRVRDTGSPSLASTVSVSVEVDAVNDAPTFTSPTTTRRVSESAEAGDNVGAPVTATDVDENDTLTYSLSGADASSFDIDAEGQIKVGDGVTFDVETKDTYTVMVDADDGNGGTASIGVTITVTTGPVGPLIFIGGGGGPPPGPTQSEADFEWTVTRDIEEPDSGNDWPTGLWSDGASLFIAENGQGAADDIYAYDFVTGERVDEHEFELHETNRAPRGFWSDGDTVWVSDSGQDRLFAYDLETGDRVEEREIELPRDNRDARGIWSDGATMWVLDGRADALFAYDLASGELLAEYELDSANDDPHGIWSDHFTVWVSNHDPKRLFAYRLPAPEGPAAEDADAIFKGLRGARNNSPRGIWSDGEVMYVADESDDRVYTYNMPDAIDARLAHAQRHRHRGVDPSQPDYEAVVADGVTETTVAAEAAQDDAMVEIAPNDADVEADGHQIAVEGGAEITVTVTSPDDSRKKVYRVELVGAGPAPECLRGAVTVGFSLVVSEGGSIENVDACARSRNVTALYTLYTLDGGEYVSYIPGAPELVNDRFSALYAGGVPALTPLIARSDGPATAAPVASGVTGPWAACLQGEIVEGFNLEVVGEEAVLAAVGDPEERAVGPHTARGAVRLVEFEFAVFDALSAT